MTDEGLKALMELAKGHVTRGLSEREICMD